MFRWPPSNENQICEITGRFDEVKCAVQAILVYSSKYHNTVINDSTPSITTHPHASKNDRL